MFGVIFEVNPHPERRDDYLGYAQMLRPELERIDGFIEVERFSSKRRDGWMLSLSIWRDEKAVIRWRTHGGHHAVQAKGRTEVFRDYRLRVGEIIADSSAAAGGLRQDRFDETATGAATRLAIVDLGGAAAPAQSAAGLATALGLPAEGTGGLVAWDLFESITSPGKRLLLQSWRDQAALERAGAPPPQVATRRRVVRVIRDYGMFARDEAPSYHPPVAQPRA